MINGHVLVLNRSWMAVHVATIKRAMSLFYLGHARAVHPEDFSLYDFDDWCNLPLNGNGARYVRTPLLRIRVPEVILLDGFNEYIRHEVRFTRHNVFQRDKNTCQYCGKQFPRSQLTIDHVIPQSRGGTDSWENVVLACIKCNLKKADRTPEEAQMPLIKRPTRPAWIPHFDGRASVNEIAVWRRFIDARMWPVKAQG